MRKKELWKDIRGYKGLYQVSNKGRIKVLSRVRTGWNYKNGKVTRRKYKEKILSPGICGDYLNVSLIKNGIAKTQLVHRLVAKAFIPNPKRKPNVNHIDFNSFNNRVKNLQWVTQYENIHHTIKHGRDNQPSGEKNGLSKLKNKDIQTIINLYKKGLTQKMIAKRYKVHSSTICNVIKRKVYRNVCVSM